MKIDNTDKYLIVALALGLTITLLFLALGALAQEHVELLPYGDMESWTVRHIKESALIGGKTKTMYMLAEPDTIQGTKYTRGNSPWSSSNAYARAFGVNKVSVSMTPERRGNGWCARLETRLEIVTAVGIDLKALATGSLYTGVLTEPVTMAHSKDPGSAIDMGIPFTGRPKALVLDYKAKINPEGQIVFANAGTKVKKVAGQDKGQIVFVLQHRWEENGHVYAYRVGTATEYIRQSTAGWVNAHRVEVCYGEPKTDCQQPWHELSNDRFKTHNSEGKMVNIEEIGWRGDLKPTHMIIQISSGCQAPFTGCPGNVVWVDNIGLVYDTPALAQDR
ncbi:MAG: PCMD domain-containing protein [Paludibacteraceae bacterium]|nr:PCMD domain-containing protein [Paludibacteraceae bacterium]